MVWREIISRAFDEDNAKSSIKSVPHFASGASLGELRTVETVLDIPFPPELRSLLLETNGVVWMLDLDGDLEENLWLVWPTNEIAEKNLEIRKGLYESNINHQRLLYFCTLGEDGILLGFKKHEAAGPIYAWKPIGDKIVKASDSLEDCLSRWILEELQV